MRVKYFCYEENVKSIDLEDKFKKEDGYKILITLITKINYFAKEIDTIVNAIEVLENWKKETWYTEEQTYRIYWGHGYGREVYEEEVTLAKANELYKETKIKYETLYELFVISSQIHYKDPDKLVNKYFQYNN
ncbi:MAG: hypothetical protein ACRC68_16095 [Clostridium sp.]